METLEKQIIEMVLLKKDNNLDQKDNLDTIPEKPAVYGIFGRINGQAVNCRHVATTQNLRKSIVHHFSNDESYECLRTFMQSIKIKCLVYQLTDNVAEAETMKSEWESRHKPECNEQLNKIH